MAAALSAHDIALDPRWLPHEFAADGRFLTSVLLPPDARRSLLFLTDGHLRDKYQRATLPTDALASAVGDAPRAPLHFIFHSSFCCSTLLANALAVPGTSSILKEPNILVNVAERVIGRGA